jgi:hypothetical protein
MKEHYLHYLWKNKLIPFHKLHLKDGTPFKVKNPGKWNRYAGGPDFLDAQIEMYGLTWFGHVEIHVNSMDWYDHNHHLDDAYKAVILHVVYRSNGTVRIHNQSLPELELIHVVNEKHFQSFGEFKMKPKIYCSKHVALLNERVVKRSYETSFSQRIEKKALIKENQGMKDQDLLLVLFARAFGGKLNASPFTELIRHIPLSLFFSLCSEKRHRIYALVSGLFNARDAFDNDLLNEMEVNGITLMRSCQWTQGGIYSNASPKKRVLQFPVFLESFFYSSELGSTIAPMSLKNFIRHMMDSPKSAYFPASFLSHVFVNALVPFFYVYQLKQGLPTLNKCRQLLLEIPPEKNHIINLWKNAGIHPKNAFESQALLEIFTDFCTNKKCLSCVIGNEVLNR